LNESIYASGNNLSDVISITDNNVFVNSTLDVGFNTSANVTLSGLGLTTPRVLVDYEDDGTFEYCTEAMGCYNLSYGGGIFVFNVSHFTSYQVEESTGLPSGYKFVVQDSAGANVASFDDKGDAYFSGAISEEESSLIVPANSFIIQNSSGAVVAYVDNSGNIFMKGTVSIQDSLGGLTSGNLEFRNSTDDLVSFFDNLGNLKLKGGYLTEYSSP